MTLKQNEGNVEVIANLNKGTNQVGVRNYNERLILQLIRKNKALTKAEATRATGLSPNAISVIFRSLEDENFLLRGDPLRGRIGQPSVPMHLNPKAAFYLGLKIGRKSLDLILMDFVGNIIGQKKQNYAFPLPESCVQFVNEKIPLIIEETGVSYDKISGLGIAIPYELWNWTEKIGAPADAMASWEGFDLESSIVNPGNWPVFIENDGTAACAAELMFGVNQLQQDFIYFYVGTMIGGGIVLNGSVFIGPSGNAGGLGPMPIPSEQKKASTLVDHASIFVLENMIKDSGESPQTLYEAGDAWVKYTTIVDQWVCSTAKGLAHAVIASLSVIDFKNVVIDGSFPEHIREKIVLELSVAIDKHDLQGIKKPDINPGGLGYIARAIGAASLPLSQQYAINQNTLFRS